MTFEVSADRYQGRFADSIEPGSARTWLEQCAGWFDASSPMPDAPTKINVAQLRPESYPDVVVIKRMWPRKPLFIRRLRGRIMLDRALRLAAVGVDIARPLAVLLPRAGSDSVLYVEEFLDLPNLVGWAHGGAPGDRTALALALANNMVCLHRNSMRDRDLKGGNVLVDAGVPERVVFIDFEGLRVRALGKGPFGARTRSRDLARLLMSLLRYDDLDATVWRPMLEVYAERMGDDLEAIDAKARALCLARRSRNERRGRPIS